MDETIEVRDARAFAQVCLARRQQWLRTWRSVYVHFSFLLLGRGGWRRIYNSSVTFFLFRRRIVHRRFSLFASRQERDASEQTNVFFHTNQSYFRGKVAAFWSLLLLQFATCIRACSAPVLA